MNLKFSNVLMFIVVYIFIFYSFNILLFGSSNILTNFPNTNFLSYNHIYQSLQTLLGGQWYLGPWSLQSIENAVIYALLPFAYFFSIIVYLGMVLYWIYLFMSFPFTFMPSPLNIIVPIFLGILISVSLMSSIRVMESGIE